MATAFDFDAGVYQGRIESANGQHVFELGHALAHQWVRLSESDSNSLEQTADYSTTPFTRVALAIRAPSVGEWTLFVKADADEYLALPITRNRLLSDIALPTLAGGTQSIAIELVLGGYGVQTVELPSVQIDVITLDATADPFVVANRSPEPNETAVPVAGDIAFDVLSAGTAAGNPDVYFGETLVCSGGVAVGDWTLTESTLPDAVSKRFVLTPPAGLSPETQYSLRVVHAGTTTTWSFTTEDTVGPSVASALATDDREVRVTWSETIVGPGSYAIALVSGVPAVTPIVTSATMQTDGSVLLALDTEMTPGATYLLTASGVTDLLGNALVGATKQFTGYQPPVPAGRSFDLFSMLLAHDQESEDLRLFVACYQEVVNLLLSKIDRFMARAIDIDSADEAWLDAMLIDMGNPFGFDLTVNEKRKLLAVLVDIYRQKGTDAGIINAVRLLMGLEITITSPWRTGWHVGIHNLGVTTTLASGTRRDWYSYFIHAPVYLTVEQRKRITQIARYMQRAPCHLRAILEPSAPPSVPDHWQLGLSRLGVNTVVHAS